MLTTAKLSAKAALLSVCALGSSCVDRSGDTLVVTGSSTVAPLVAEIGKRFESRNPGVRVDVHTGGSSRGIADARARVADIGMVSRALRAGREADLRSISIARDGIALVVHRDNTVRGLSNAQVVAIYTGQLTNWRELGGRDAAITVVHKAEGRSTLELFLAYFDLKNSAVRPHVVIGDNEQGIKTIAGNPHAVGYVSIGTAEYAAKHGVAIRMLPVAGVEATLENVRNGTFPMSRALNLVVVAPPSGRVQAFLDFSRSADVHDLVRSQYFVPISDG